MKTITVLLSMWLFASSCGGQYAQIQSNNDKKMIVEKFDIKRFNAKSEYGTYEFTTADGVKVKQHEDSEYPSGEVNGYFEYRKCPNSPYEYYNEYDASGNIVVSSVTFYDVSTGIRKEYDLSGNVIKEENLDVGYPFSINALIEKMQTEHDIDLLNEPDKFVDRYIEQEYLNIPIYKVEIMIKTPLTQYMDVYLIDGNIGELLYKAKRPAREDPFFPSEPIESEYARLKNNDNQK